MVFWWNAHGCSLVKYEWDVMEHHPTGLHRSPQVPSLCSQTLKALQGSIDPQANLCWFQRLWSLAFESCGWRRLDRAEPTWSLILNPGPLKIECSLPPDLDLSAAARVPERCAGTGKLADYIYICIDLYWFVTFNKISLCPSLLSTSLVQELPNREKLSTSGLDDPCARVSLRCMEARNAGQDIYGYLMISCQLCSAHFIPFWVLSDMVFWFPVSQDFQQLHCDCEQRVSLSRPSSTSASLWNERHGMLSYDVTTLRLSCDSLWSDLQTWGQWSHKTTYIKFMDP
jgi:hypothetical protein